MNASVAPRVLIAGASCRAAAQALSQFHCEITAIDLFGDWDLHQLVNVHVASNMLDLISLFKTQLNHGGSTYDFILFCGGMENYATDLAQLWTFNSPASFANSEPVNKTPVLLLADIELQTRLRSCKELRSICENSMVNLAADYVNPGSPTRWIAKPRNSCGGVGIREFNIETDSLANGERLEPYIPGIDLSIIVANRFNGWETIAVCESLPKVWFPQPLNSLDGHDFVYGGSQRIAVEYQNLPKSLRRQIESFVTAFSIYDSRRNRSQDRLPQYVQFDFRMETTEQQPEGLFGTVDCSGLDGDYHNNLWLLECNPRWTASMELLTIAEVRSMFSGVFTIKKQSGIENHQDDSLKKNGRISAISKQIVFASQPLVVSRKLHEILVENSVCEANASSASRFRFADIPMPSTKIEQGEPITSVLVNCANEGSQTDALVEAIAMLEI